MLERAAQMCLALAEAAHQHAMAQVAAGEDVEKAVLTHGRAMRTLRQTLALADRFDRPAPVRTVADRVDRAERAAAREKLRPEALRRRPGPDTVRRGTVHEAISALILAETPDTREGWRTAERLADDLGERLYDMPFEAFLGRPISATIGEICAAIGIVPDWGFWEEADWAIEEVRKAVRGSPYVSTFAEASADLRRRQEREPENALAP